MGNIGNINPDYAQSMVKNAYQDLFTRFQWSKLAQQTINTYHIVAKERQLTIWE